MVVIAVTGFCGVVAIVEEEFYWRSLRRVRERGGLHWGCDMVIGDVCIKL